MHAPQPDPFAPARLGAITLRNRIIKAATFEGLTPENTVTDALIAFHRRLAAGGIGMTTVAFCAVSPDGRGAPNEIIMRDAAVPDLARLADAVHAEGAAVSAQIGASCAAASSSSTAGPMHSSVPTTRRARTPRPRRSSRASPRVAAEARRSRRVG